MEERIIVSLTTYIKRIGNIPVVLETIFNQTLPPDFVVLNLAFDEIVPDNVQKYIDSRCIEVNRVSDTKVFKKLIPTLKKYPNAVVISIDDDWLYPQGMIEDFMEIHKKYPNYPISGNKEAFFNFQCHCGCASLTKAEYLGEYLDMIDEDVMNNCKSDDFVYTYFANKAGHPYIRTKGLYYENLEPYNEGVGYTSSFGAVSIAKDSYEYLINRFGPIEGMLYPYIQDHYLSDVIYNICFKAIQKQLKEKIEREYKSSYSYKIGSAFLRPIRFIIDLFGKNE